MKKTFYYAVIALLFSSTHALCAQPFEQWLDGVKQEARSKGIREPIIREALDGVQPIPRIIELDRKQPEGKLSFDQYKKRVITQARIDQGRAKMAKHKDVLRKVEQKYGVPASVIVALWGIETSYGQNTGGFKVIDALATLAHDGRRSDFFRDELFRALNILNEGHIDPKDMKGSWAGAMGQNQFMPSSFERLAVDEDGDGHKDIWNTTEDVFASSANFLSKSGWNAAHKWGRRVKLSQPIPESLTGRDKKKPLKEWKAMGVLQENGQPIPVVDGMMAGIVQPDGAKGDTFLVYDNYDVIMSWNRSVYFASSVGLLADYIARPPQ